MSKDKHKRGELERKVKAQEKQQSKFDKETERLILLIKKNRLK